MSLVSFRPILRPFNAPSVAPATKTKRQRDNELTKNILEGHTDLKTHGSVFGACDVTNVSRLLPVMQDPPMVKKASSNRPLVLLAPVGRMNSSVS